MTEPAIVISPLDTSSNAVSRMTTLDPANTESSFSGAFSRAFSPAINRSQAYYWSRIWQMGEQESRAELAAGHGRTFDTAEEAIRWLLS